MKTCALLICTTSPSYNLPNAKPLTNAYHLNIGVGAAFLRAGPLPALRVNGEVNFGKTTINANRP